MTTLLAAPSDALAPVAPSKSEVQAAIPAHCFERSTARSMAYAVFSIVITFGPGLLAWQFLPMTWAWSPVWALYALVVGTNACGVWVVAHECGHGGFSDNKRVQDGVGFVLHSALLVPYYSWQRSHAIHHAKTNHVTDGETHVPKRTNTSAGQRALAARKRLGAPIHTMLSIFGRLAFGWPVYLLTGATGGTERGTTNHFWPWAPFSKALFPARWARRVFASAIGVVVVIGLLISWAVAAGSIMPPLVLYVIPYLVCNAWLVGYTWLHHTGVDTPHFEGDDWSFVRGAFCSIDRPYGPVFDLVHHRIGSTHVAHHLFARIPHYHAKEATEAIAKAFPDLYRFDPTPIHKAVWGAAKDCVAVTPVEGGWSYVDAEYVDAENLELATRIRTG